MTFWIYNFILVRSYPFTDHILLINRYRPPDVLFGAKLYTTSIDMWSAGCIFAGTFAFAQNR